MNSTRSTQYAVPVGVGTTDIFFTIQFISSHINSGFTFNIIKYVKFIFIRILKNNQTGRVYGRRTVTSWTWKHSYVSETSSITGQDITLIMIKQTAIKYADLIRVKTIRYNKSISRIFLNKKKQYKSFTTLSFL